MLLRESSQASYVENLVDNAPAALDVFLHLALAKVAQALRGQVCPHTALADILEEDLNFEILSITLVFPH